MKVLQKTVGMIGTNCYIAFEEDTKEGVVIDPGDQGSDILKMVEENGVNVRYVLLTHGHFDHILAVSEVCEKTGAKLVIHSLDSGMLVKSAANRSMGTFMVHKDYTEHLPDLLAEDGTEITVGNTIYRYIHTPGHTPGSCVIQAGNNLLFTGDTLFCGSCGRCDLSGGDFHAMLISLKKLYELPGDYQVFPGHERTSTLEKERQYNSYMQQAVGR